MSVVSPARPLEVAEDVASAGGAAGAGGGGPAAGGAAGGGRDRSIFASADLSLLSLWRLPHPAEVKPYFINIIDFANNHY